MRADVAVVSSARWSSFRLSKHFIALELADGGRRVLYVDPPMSPLSTRRDPARRQDRSAPVDDPVGDRLHVWRPRVLPGQNGVIGQALNAVALRRGVLARARPELVVAFSLESRSLLGRLPGARVYYCTDSDEDLPGVDAEAVRRWQRRMIAAADVVVACSKPLAEQLADRGARVTYIPHGCDASSFTRAATLPEALAGRPRPFVGYVGSINFRVDASFVAAAHAATGGTLVLVGGGFGPSPAPAVAELVARPDVVALGHVEAAGLAAVMASLDVGLVPYAPLPFNRKSFPIKVLQYLAAGVPVVSTPNGATDELGDVVACAGTAADFGDAALAATQDRSEAADAARRLVALGRPWSAAVDRLCDAAGVARR